MKSKDTDAQAANDTILDKSPIRRPPASVWTIFVLSFSALIAFTILCPIFQERMAHDSIRYSKHLQDQSQNGGAAASVIGDIITAVVIAYVILAFFLRHNKMGPFLRFFTLNISIWLNISLRLIYADTRPSYSTTELRGYDYYCETDFGNPSGHTITVVPVILLIVVDLYEESLHKYWFLGLSLLFAAGIAVIIIFIRLFLGVHFYYQLILGTLWGIFIVATMQLFRPLMYRYVLQPILYKVEFADRRRLTRLILWIFILAFNVTAYVAYGIRYRTHGIGSQFYDSIVNCTYVLDDFHRNFATKLLSYGVTFNWILFFFLGLNDTPRNVRYGYRFFEERRVGKLFLRALLFVAMNIPVVFAFVPEEDDVVGTVLRPSLILPIFGYLTGRFLVTLEEKWGLMPARPSTIPQFAPTNEAYAFPTN